MKKELTIQLQCRHFPGRRFGLCANVHLGVQRRKETIWETPGDALAKDFNIPVLISEGKDGTPNFTGEFVYGKTGDKFLYLVWYDKKDKKDERFRRAKIKLQHLEWPALNEAIEKGSPIVATVNLTGSKGDPVCASLKADNILWQDGGI